MIRASQLPREQQRRVAIPARPVDSSRWEYLRYTRMTLRGGPQLERWPVATIPRTTAAQIGGPILIAIGLGFAGYGVALLATKDDSLHLKHSIGQLALGIGLSGFVVTGAVTTGLGFGLDAHVSAKQPGWIFLENSN